MSSDDGGAIASRRRGRRVRVVSGVSPETTQGFASFETAQGAGIIGIPVECYKFVQGSNVWRFTSADRDIVLNDGTFTPATISRDSLDFSQEETALNLAIKVPRSNPVAQLFVGYNPPTPVTLTVWRKHRSDPEEVAIFALGKVITATFEGPEATLTVAPISQMFRRRVPALVFQSHCNWALYGNGCGISKASFKDSGTVLAVAGVSVRVAIFASHPDGWYSNGWLEDANGARQFIVDHVGEVVTLQFPMSGLVAGAAVDAYAGCDRTEATCAAKFSNLVHHLGFPRVPTRNPYSGSIV